MGWRGRAAKLGGRKYSKSGTATTEATISLYSDTDLSHDDGFLRGKELRWSQTGVETPDATAILIKEEAESLLKAAEEAKGSDAHQEEFTASSTKATEA